MSPHIFFQAEMSSNSTVKGSKRQKVETNSPSPANLHDSYPSFTQATVQIRFSDQNIYQLHKDILASNSGWFRELFSQIDDAVGTSKPNQYVLELTKISQEQQDLPMLKLTQDALHTKPIDQTVPPSTVKLLNDRALYANDVLFGLMYERPIRMSLTDVEQAYMQCADVIHLAEVYGNAVHVGLLLSQKLSEFRRILYEAIGKDPVKWLNLALKIRSGMIFSEALTHCVGGYPNYSWPTSLELLQPEARTLVAKKASQLTHWRLKVDLALLTNSLVSDSGEAVDLSESLEAWFVDATFHQWIRTKMRECSATQAWSTNKFYKILAVADDSYLSIEDVWSAFIEKFDGFDDGDEEAYELLLSNLTILKKNAAKEVTALLANNLTVDVANIPYFTCTDCKPGEYPWD